MTGSSPWVDLANAIANLVQVAVNVFGVFGTIIIAIVIYVVLAVRRIYLDSRKDKDVDRAMKAMEESVQRSAKEAREWRVLFMRDKAGWSLEDAERIIMAADFPNPTESRTELEKRFKGSENIEDNKGKE